MDPEAATELVRKGSTLLLLDVPQRTLFGVDTQVCAILPATTLPALFVRASNNLTGISPQPASCSSSTGVLCRAQVQRDEDGAAGAAFRLLLLLQQVPI
jgi:hypothetical protein